MKRMSLLLILALLISSLSLAACSSNPETTQPNVPNAQEQQQTYPLPIVEPDKNYSKYLKFVDSTCFSEVGYSNDDTLVVKFLESGSEYIYSGVTEDVYLEMINAESIGIYYNEYIKGNYYCERIY